LTYSSKRFKKIGIGKSKKKAKINENEQKLGFLQKAADPYKKISLQ
jgi:hypothetical protein